MMKQFSACQPRSVISASASLTPAWIFSAVMPGGSAGSEKSTVAGSKPINTTRFIDPPRNVQTQGPYSIGAGSAIELAIHTSVENSLCPAEVFQCQTGVPYFGHVRDLVTLKLHHVDVIRGDSPPGRRNWPALAGMGPIKYAIRADAVSGDVRRE